MGLFSVRRKRNQPVSRVRKGKTLGSDNKGKKKIGEKRVIWSEKLYHQSKQGLFEEAITEAIKEGVFINKKTVEEVEAYIQKLAKGNAAKGQKPKPILSEFINDAHLKKLISSELRSFKSEMRDKYGFRMNDFVQEGIVDNINADEFHRHQVTQTSKESQSRRSSKGKGPKIEAEDIDVQELLIQDQLHAEQALPIRSTTTTTTTTQPSQEIQRKHPEQRQLELWAALELDEDEQSLETLYYGLTEIEEMEKHSEDGYGDSEQTLTEKGRAYKDTAQSLFMERYKESKEPKSVNMHYMNQACLMDNARDTSLNNKEAAFKMRDEKMTLSLLPKIGYGHVIIPENVYEKPKNSEETAVNVSRPANPMENDVYISNTERVEVYKEGKWEDETEAIKQALHKRLYVPSYMQKNTSQKAGKIGNHTAEFNRYGVDYEQGSTLYEKGCQLRGVYAILRAAGEPQNTLNHKLPDKYTKGGIETKRYSIGEEDGGYGLDISGNERFIRGMKNALDEIGDKKVGKALFQKLKETNKKVEISPSRFSEVSRIGEDGECYYKFKTPERPQGERDNADGSLILAEKAEIKGDPENEIAGPYNITDDKDWRKRPVSVALFHELVHAWHHMSGEPLCVPKNAKTEADKEGYPINQIGPCDADTAKNYGDDVEELRTVGLPYKEKNIETETETGTVTQQGRAFDFENNENNPITENVLRAELKLEERPHYTKAGQ